MGNTVESHRMALEDEIRRWKGFEKALRIEDKEAFEELMDACRSYASSAGSNATQPMLFDLIVVSILLCQQKKITCLEKMLNAAERTAKD
jgi:hypothetical protein